MARTVSQGFEVFMSNLVPLASQQTAAASHRSSIEKSLRSALEVSTIWETGSFHHGTGVRGHADVDLLVSLKNKPNSSDTALRWVREALQESFPFTRVRTSRPAIVVEFASGSETVEVIPGFLTSRGDSDVFVYDIPAADSGWMDTAPKAHLNYVNECNNRAGVKGAAKKLSRLAKAWKYYNNVPISSFYLEMRAAQYITTQSSYIAVWDICGLLEDLHSKQLAAMNDPKSFSGRFHPCSSEAKKMEALSKLNTGASRARKALDAYNADDPATAFHYLDLLFGGNFPSR
ncbi:SMODS domain-containing nucleotidyltransferase [Rhodococcus sp. ACT016]|uniref:SMODS domain-containing nucleotidyltransferase n=1 Tax=Rhodococcus sp. ACT016 TaxID=3134808 RepID=UPI003D2AF684